MTIQQEFIHLFTYKQMQSQNRRAGRGQAPGKLYIGGEYAVLEPGQPAILVGLNQYIEVTIQISSLVDQGHWQDQTSQKHYDYHRHLGEIQVSDSYWTNVAAAIQVVEALIHADKILDYDIQIQSQLNHQSGPKLGLGSSGAVTVAVIRALLDFYGYQANSPKTIYQLAALAHLEFGSNGSLGDLAAAAYGSWIYYRAVDRYWLKEQLAQGHSVDLLGKAWPQLEIRYLQVQEDLELHIGWTQSPASSTHYVKQIQSQIPNHRSAYQAFLDKSDLAVNSLRKGLEEAKPLLIYQAIHSLKDNLYALDAALSLGIITPHLKQLIDIAEDKGFVSKSSGAGGGDCGIALGYHHQESLALEEAWQAQGIAYLTMAVCPRFDLERTDYGSRTRTKE